MSAHASQAFSIAHCTDSEDLPSFDNLFYKDISIFSEVTSLPPVVTRLMLEIIVAVVRARFRRRVEVSVTNSLRDRAKRSE